MRAKSGIATALIDHRTFGNDREAFERALDAELTAQRIDLVCLAGFMRLLTPWFVTRWSGRLLNIHPALLPEFKGLHTHRRALEAGAKRHGATVHFVVPETNSGPIIVAGFGPGHRRRHRRDARRAGARSRAPHLSAGAATGRRRPGILRSSATAIAKNTPLACALRQQKTPGSKAGGYENRVSRYCAHATFRFSAEVLPRLVTSSNSTS